MTDCQGCSRLLGSTSSAAVRKVYVLQAQPASIAVPASPMRQNPRQVCIDQQAQITPRDRRFDHPPILRRRRSSLPECRLQRLQVRFAQLVRAPPQANDALSLKRACRL